jgi:3-hydroxymyristoyl/3-hydroxydecanoyl-(acyl carrier protein) dehydratase
VLLSKYANAEPGAVPVVTRLNKAKFKAIVRPGDTVTLEVVLKDQLSGAYFLDARVMNGDKTAVTFDFVCKLAQPDAQDS